MIDTKELSRLAQAATPGPWIAAGPSFGESLPKYLNEVVVDREGDEDDGYSICNTPIGLDEECSDDMAFIAEANPAAISELLDRLEAAEKEVESWKGLSKQFSNEADALRAAIQHEVDCAEAAKAKIEQMEKQEPVAFGLYSGWTLKATYLKDHEACEQRDRRQLTADLSGSLEVYRVVPLYAQAGAQAQPAPNVSPAALRPVITWLRNGCDPAKAADELELIAAKPAPSVPDGWKLVPIEPTEKMINEGTCASTLPGPRYIDSACAKQCWTNMLAAAPKPEAKP